MLPQLPPGSTLTVGGWQAGRTDNIDGLIALCMALERAEHQPEPVELIGWL